MISVCIQGLARTWALHFGREATGCYDGVATTIRIRKDFDSTRRAFKEGYLENASVVLVRASLGAFMPSTKGAFETWVNASFLDAAAFNLETAILEAFAASMVAFTLDASKQGGQLTDTSSVDAAMDSEAFKQETVAPMLDASFRNLESEDVNPSGIKVGTLVEALLHMEVALGKVTTLMNTVDRLAHLDADSLTSDGPEVSAFLATRQAIIAA